MGRKSSAKANARTPDRIPPKRSVMPLVLIVVASAIGIGAFTYIRQSVSNASAPETAAADSAQNRPPQRTVPSDLKPHQQANLPPLHFPGYPMARPPEVVRAAYKFADEHPEITSYVPCFCGCERAGHMHNQDCFVKARDVNGDVVAWDEHGMECAVCIDVATKSAQMFASGASVRDIRAAIEKEYAPSATYHTPTPEPPPPW